MKPKIDKKGEQAVADEGVEDPDEQKADEAGVAVEK